MADLLPTRYAVTRAAVEAVTAAHLAAARLAVVAGGGRAEDAAEVRVDPSAAVTAFAAETHLRVDGRTVPVWDPLAGTYPTRDGRRVRLHTNYPHHRAAALRALGLHRAVDGSGEATRDDVEAAVAAADADDCERRVLAEGGAAAASRSASQWHAHPHREVISRLPLVAHTTLGTRSVPRSRPRVLDLTRVIAGPTAGKVLAAHGADVLRIDPPGFPEVAAVVADTTAGKRCVALDLRSATGAAAFDALLADADVVLVGLRPGALDALGWSTETMIDRVPGLVVGRLSAWGRSGPWAARRGFDSLVQVATGIADPTALPVQALDYCSGWLLAAGVLESLGRCGGEVVDVVLGRTALWLDGLGRELPAAAPPDAMPFLETVASPLGQVTRVRCPGTVGGRPVEWAGPPAPLGSADPVWLDRQPC